MMYRPWASVVTPRRLSSYTSTAAPGSICPRVSDTEPVKVKVSWPQLYSVQAHNAINQPVRQPFIAA